MSENLFEDRFAEDGSLRVWSSEQYKSGWDSVGIIPPTKEQFNYLFNRLDQKDQYLLSRIISTAADAANTVEGVASIADLRLIDADDGLKAVVVAGYYAGSSVGGGIFYADLSDTTTADNGGTVIVGADGTRWRRVYNSLSLFDFGYSAEANNAIGALNLAESAALGVVIDCCGLSINTGALYPKNNKYTNGKFVINNVEADVQYQPIRSGIGRIIAGTGAAASLITNEWTGNDLTILGVGAAAKMERCVSAIAIGKRAQGASIISRDNIAIGADSLYSVSATTEWYDQTQVSGTRNIGIGGNAGRGISSGYNNVAVGRNAGQGLSTGNGTVAVGAGACSGYAPIGFSGDIKLIWDVPMTNGVAVGAAVLQNYKKNEATVIGAYAASALKTTVKPTIIGFEAGRMLDSNIAPNGGDVIWTGTQDGTYEQVGTQILLTFANLQGAAVGYFVGVQLLDGAAQTLQGDVVPAVVVSVIDNTITINSDKSIASASGTAQLRFVYSAATNLSDNTEITAIGYKALRSATRASRTIAIGAEALFGGDGHDKTVAIGDSALRTSKHNATVAIGYFAAATVETDGCVFIGDAAGFRWQNGAIASGKVTNSIAIGRGSRVAGDNEAQIGSTGMTVYASSSVNVRSDLRDKTDIRPLDVGLDFVRNLKPISGVYDRRDAYIDDLFKDLPEAERSKKLREWWANPVKDGSKKEDKRHFWLGAQDIRDLQGRFGDLPMLQHQSQNGADTYSLAYEAFVPVLVKAIQEMAVEIDGLKKQMEAKKWQDM